MRCSPAKANVGYDRRGRRVLVVRMTGRSSSGTGEVNSRSRADRSEPPVTDKPAVKRLYVGHRVVANRACPTVTPAITSAPADVPR